MRTPVLSGHELGVLKDVVELHEESNRVLVHAQMPVQQRLAVGQLAIAGLVEVRKLARRARDDERVVVPTPEGRRMVESL